MAATIVGPIQNASSGLAGGTSAAFNITAPQVIKDDLGILVQIICIGAGSITVNDLATLTGAAATNEIWTGAMTAGQIVVLVWPCSTGIVASAVTGQFNIAFT
jgi:hypothetical protein